MIGFIASFNPKSAIGLLFFLDRDGHAAIVEAALGADSMRRARLSAVRATAHGGRDEVVVRPALAGA